MTVFIFAGRGHRRTGSYGNTIVASANDIVSAVDEIHPSNTAPGNLTDINTSQQQVATPPNGSPFRSVSWPASVHAAVSSPNNTTGVYIANSSNITQNDILHK